MEQRPSESAAGGEIELLFARAAREGRTQLFEHEVYRILELTGAGAPPRHAFLPAGERLGPDVLARLPGERVVLKIVSPAIVHKTEARGVVFVAKDHALVSAEIERLLARLASAGDVRGVLLVEQLERAGRGLGDELFVGLRTTREFGPVLAAGLGGVDTEYLAERMRPGLAVATAAALDTTPERFLELFARTAAFELISGRARGRERAVSDAELLGCFGAFLRLARSACVARTDGGPELVELEVNPFAFRDQRLVPLDGRGRLGLAPRARPPRSPEKLSRLLEPRSIAVLGVSATARNFGRIILDNLLECGFPRERLHVVKPGLGELEGVRCSPSVAALPERVDLIVLAAAAAQLPALVDECVTSGRVESAILITGGVGELAGSAGIAERVGAGIAAGRERPDGGPVFLGPNSLGVLSRPGRYDTLFIPGEKLDKGWGAPPRRFALISQSGAFIVSRLSNLETSSPTFAVSIGNQLDLTTADLVRAVAARDDVDVLGVYVEGFRELDGLEFARALGDARRAGKDVVFYKAGRSEAGRSAAAGHTASLAGDHAVAEAVAAQAGALIAGSFEEFDRLLELCVALHARRVAGLRLGVISNAGYEAVGMADSLRDASYEATLPPLDAAASASLAAALARRGLAGIVDVKNPLDLTPQASEAAYEDAIAAFLGCDGVDALVVGVVPLTAQLRTTPGELADPRSLASALPRLSASSGKPLVAVIDSGPLYDPLVRALRAGGLPVFRSADRALRMLGRYLRHRLAVERKGSPG